MALRKQSQPQPGRVAVGDCPPLELPEWPPDRDKIEQSLLGCLHSGQWSAYQGAATDQLSASLAKMSRAASVRLVSSGTIAVEMALRGCRIGPGDEVIVAAFDYPGNLRSVDATGATPVVIDIAPQRWTVDVQQIAAAVTERTRGVLVSHIYGSMADTAVIRRLADQHDIYFIEDACQTPVAALTARPADAQGHVRTLSFGGSKLLTCGNGGAILTDDPRIAGRIRLYVERPSDAVAMSQLQAAALLPQLDSLAAWAERRRQSAASLRRTMEELASVGGDDPAEDWGAKGCRFGRCEPQDAGNDYYKFAWFAPDRTSRDRQIREGQALGLPLGTGFSTFARRAASRGRLIGSLENAHHAAATTVVLDHRALAADAALLDALAHRLAAISRWQHVVR